MSDVFFHETLFRGETALSRLKGFRLTVCGAGAIGSQLVDNLVRQGLQAVTVIDDDRIEAHNVGTQIYALSDVGAYKVEVLQAELFRVATVEIKAVRQRLTSRTVRKMLTETDLVVDGFDNNASRTLVTDFCQANRIPCLHVGLYADYAEVIWNEFYTVPRDVSQGNVCDYPLARNVIQFAVALASETIIRFIVSGDRENYSFTLQDLHINPEHVEQNRKDV